ncbi:MAG: hypothetical protein J6Y78_17845 [Paludibacteraceae bacterium]|nr:hypothetical protein [Paludibacteraceae bacterium]
MGGNGSYSKEFGGVPTNNRTHWDTAYRIDGHKVLVFQDNPSHDKFIMNSNSEKPIYLFASADKNSGQLTISAIGIYEKHALVESIDLKFDNDGNYLPFSEGESGSHSHKWEETAPGKFGRVRHDRSNYFPVDGKYHDLILKIVEFNKMNKIWDRSII